jgi:hypothetical protein
MEFTSAADSCCRLSIKTFQERKFLLSIMMVDDMITVSFLFLKFDKPVIQLINHQILIVNKNLHKKQKNIAHRKI